MKRNTCRVILALAALVVLALVAYSPAAAQQFSAWSAPVNLGPPINSSFGELGPAISKHGRSLYFYSGTRPGGFGGEDIWVAQRASLDAPWGEPVNLAMINTSAREFAPSLSRDGHWLFFSSDRPGGSGGVDIWASWRAHTHDDFGWQPPVNLGAGVNSAASDFAPNYFENKDVGIPLLFFSSNRPGGPGGSDIYVSELTSDGSFGPAVLVPELSSPQNDARPSIRHDGREIFFYSNRPGSIPPDPPGALLEDLWVATRETTLDAWSTPVNLGATVNSAFSDLHPAVSSDRQTLFFSSNRPGGVGGFDLYMTTRTKLRRR